MAALEGGGRDIYAEKSSLVMQVDGSISLFLPSTHLLIHQDTKICSQRLPQSNLRVNSILTVFITTCGSANGISYRKSLA